MHIVFETVVRSHAASGIYERSACPHTICLSLAENMYKCKHSHSQYVKCAKFRRFYQLNSGFKLVRHDVLQRKKLPEVYLDTKLTTKCILYEQNLFN